MGWLSLNEASAMYDIPATTLRDWCNNDKVIWDKQPRGGRKILVVDEDSLRLLTGKEPKDSPFIDDVTGRNEDEQESPNTQLILNVAHQLAISNQRKDELIGQLNNEIKELNGKIAELSEEKGRLSGDVTTWRELSREKDERIKEKDAIIEEKSTQLRELQEWQRQIAATKEKRPWWKFWN